VVGEARRGWLGISVAADDVEARARALGEGGGVAGVAIETVEAGSPAEAAGLRAGDRIVALDGAPIPDVLALQRRSVGLLADETVRFTVRRGDEELDLEATLSTRPPGA
jgi:S1-C subfamily serine protease